MAGTAQATFAPREDLALRPEAFGGLFGAPAPADVKVVDGIATVSIHGPLMQREHWLFDSYDAIVARVGDAIAMSPDRIVLSVDSPGGVVAGCFDAAEKIRSMADVAGVELYAHVDGMAASAAYALASVADEIVVADTAQVGSIGVIAGLMDWTQANAEMGLRVEMVATGGRKTDGNPNVPITDDAIAAAQTRIDAMGEVFFAHVAHHRNMAAQAVRQLDAGILVGAAAVAAGLADRVSTNARADQAQETAMNEQERKALALALGLSPDASAQDIQQGATAQSAALATTQEHLALAQAKLADLEASAAAEAKSHRAAEVERLIAHGSSAGKIPPALVDDYRELCATDAGMRTVKAMIAKAPSMVADDGDADPASGPADTLSPAQKMIADELGVAHADYLETLKKNGGR